MKLTNNDVQDILRLLDASPVDELHLQTERFKLSLKRNSEGDWSQEMQELSEPKLVENTTNAVPSEKDKASTNNSSTLSETNLLEIQTPLPGTFYRAPKPGAPPFVEIGDRVEENTVIAIVETMKLMNSINAGVSGTVVEICLENAEAVEKGAVLMRIDPKGS